MTRTQAPRVLFSASNLHVGGGVQVAASLVDEILAMANDSEIVEKLPWLPDVDFEVSPEVARSMIAPSTENHRIEIKSRSWRNLSIWRPQRIKPYDIEFVVFGPRYGVRRAITTIVGIADVTSIYRWPEGIDVGPISMRLRRLLRGLISRHMFKREDYLVSESEALIAEFRRRTGYPSERTYVVPNTINRALLDAARREPKIDWRDDAVGDGETVLAYVARYYPHKNHGLLPKLANELVVRGIKARFLLTLAEAEWQGAPQELRNVSMNAGVLPVSGLADLYRSADAVIFPSLLESFSATPIEALATNGLLFASDRPFVREVCGDAAIYIDPIDPKLAAERISSTLHDAPLCKELRGRSRDVVAVLPTAQDRAMKITKIIDTAIEQGDS